MLSNKVCHAVIRKSAEFAILTQENAGLTKVVAAKTARKKSKRTVLSTGRVLTLFQVHELREEEKQGKGKKRPREDDDIDVEKAANEAPRARIANVIDTRQEHGGLGAHLDLEEAVPGCSSMNLPETVALGKPAHTGARSIKAHRAPQKCSGCGAFGHNYRNCPEK